MNFLHKGCQIEIGSDNKIRILTKSKEIYHKLKQEGKEVQLIELLSGFLQRNKGNLTLLRNKLKLLGKEITTLGYLYEIEPYGEIYICKFKLNGERYYFTSKVRSNLKINNYYLLKGKLIKDDFYNKRASTLERVLGYEEYTFETNQYQMLEFVEEEKEQIRPRYEFHLHTVKSQRDAFITNEELKEKFDSGELAVCAITDHGIPNSFPDSIKDFGKEEKYKVNPAIELYVVDDDVLKLNREKWEADNELVFDKKKELEYLIEQDEIKISDLVEKIENETLSKTDHENNKDINLFSTDKEYKAEYNSILKSIRNIIKDLKSELKEIKTTYSLNKKELKELNESLKSLMLTEPNLGDATRFHVSLLLKCKDEIYRDKVNSYEFKYNPGIYEMNKAITKSFTETFGKTVLNKSMGNRNIVLLSELKKLKETGYFKIHSACSMGFITNYLIEDKEYLADQYIDLFDAIEIQPVRNNLYLIDLPEYKNFNNCDDIKLLNRRIYNYALKHNKPVIFTSDAHLISAEQTFKRAIFKKSYISMIVSKKSNADFEAVLKDNQECKQPFFHNYIQMVNELKYQGFNEEEIEQIYLNEKKIGEELSFFNNTTIIPKQMFIPDFKGIDIKKELLNIIDENYKKMYGEIKHERIQKILDKEIEGVFNSGYAFSYYVSMLLVKESERNGYPVGSRGSVGSSLLAMFTGITTNNPLPPHYFCNCGYIEWMDGEYSNGLDLPIQKCPNCNKNLKRDGFDGDISSFLGKSFDKIPDID